VVQVPALGPPDEVGSPSVSVAFASLPLASGAPTRRSRSARWRLPWAPPVLDGGWAGSPAQSARRPGSVRAEWAASATTRAGGRPPDRRRPHLCLRRSAARAWPELSRRRGRGGPPDALNAKRAAWGKPVVRLAAPRASGTAGGSSASSGSRARRPDEGRPLPRLRSYWASGAETRPATQVARGPGAESSARRARPRRAAGDR